MSFTRSTVACEGIPPEKTSASQLTRPRPGCLGRSDPIRAIAGALSNEKAKDKSGIFYRRAARAQAQSPPPCSFYLVVRSAGVSGHDTAGALPERSREMALASLVSRSDAPLTSNSSVSAVVRQAGLLGPAGLGNA